MSTLINTNESISDIALAYFDEEEEVLKEITEDNLEFYIFPYGSEYKRLYLIGDLIYTNIIKITATVTDELYEVKLKLIDNFNSNSDFNDATNVIHCTVTNNYLNAIPIDILVTSTGISYEKINLNIELNTEG